MRAIHVTRHGSPDVLEEVQQTASDPGPGEVRIRVKAAGVNFADVLARSGAHVDVPPPFVPGCEVSGYIDAIGPGPTRHEVGRRVVAITRAGGYADSLVVPDDLAFNAPVVLSHNEAAAIPMSFLTAVVALYRMANVKAGETVLVHNVGGGVGVAALQLARLRRAVVIGTASASKHNALRSLGIDHVVDRESNVADAVMDLTRGRGADVVIDPVGGENAVRSFGMLAPLGRLVTAGVPDLGALPPLTHNRGIFALDFGFLWTERRVLHASMEALLTDFAAGRLKAVVAKAFPLARANDAHRFIEERVNVGKVVLTC